MPVTGGLATAAILGGSSLLGGVLGSNSAKDAAEAQAKAMKYAANLQDKQFQQTRGDLSPYREAGLPALSTYSNALGLGGQDAAKQAWSSYTESPALTGMLSRIRDNVQASNAARGGLFSGATAQGIGDRSTQAYMEDSGNWLSRLAGLYGTGENAAAQTGNLGAASAANQGNLIAGAGQANANGIIGGANSTANALGSLSNIYGQYRGGAFDPKPIAGGGNVAGSTYKSNVPSNLWG